jgi:hypothetical protein
MDGVLYNNPTIDVIHNIDKSIDPNKKYKFGGNAYTISEINQMLPVSEDKVSFLIEWDNMCQCMAIGLVDLLNSILSQSRQIPLEDFFTRDDTFVDNLDYVVDMYKNTTRKELILATYKAYYPEIMQKSPVTLFFDRLNLLKPMAKSITFIFRHNFPGLSDFVQTISKEKFFSTVECTYTIANDESSHIKLAHQSNSSVYIVPDMGLYYDTFMKFNKKNKTIISYNDHNGINKYLLAMYVNIYMDDSAKPPNNIRLNFINEVEDKGDNLNEAKSASLR